MAEIHCTDSVRLAVIDQATIWMLAHLQTVAEDQNVAVVTVTSGSDGQHSGPADPHHRGHALDIRSHDFPTPIDKLMFANALQDSLGALFYVFLEDAGQPNEHIHVQVRKGCTYPPLAPMNGAALKV